MTPKEISSELKILIKEVDSAKLNDELLRICERAEFLLEQIEIKSRI